VGVVVEAEHAVPEPTREQDVQRNPPVAAGPDDSNPYLLVEAKLLYLNFWLRDVGGSFGLSYLPLLPTEKAPGTEGSLAPLLASCSDADIVGG
jgi:hypothetical protein